MAEAALVAASFGTEDAAEGGEYQSIEEMMGGGQVSIS